MTEAGWTIIGVDPAPSKPTVAFIGRADATPMRKQVEAADLPGWIAGQSAKTDRLLVAWDAPLSFDERHGFYRRPFDDEVSRLIERHEKTGRLAIGAVSVRAFAACSHWAISCASLGLPAATTAYAGPRFEIPAIGWRPPDVGGHFVVEVHPAVAIVMWWLHPPTRSDALPRYKPGRSVKKREARAALARVTAWLIDEKLVPAVNRRDLEDDDGLDALVAWTMARDFLRGTATWFGRPTEGGYVLPLGAEDLLSG